MAANTHHRAIQNITIKTTKYFHRTTDFQRSPSSYAVAKPSGLESMGPYFKPFTSHSLIVAISVVVLVVHTIIVLIYRAKKKPNNK